MEMLLLFTYRDRQGFTFIEMLLTLSILIILSVAAIPSFITFLQKYRVMGATQNLYYILREARSESIKTNSIVYVTFDSTDPWCYGVNTTSACNCRSPSSCSLGTGGQANTGTVILSSTGLSSNSIIFEPTRGMATNGSTQLTLTANGQTIAMGIKITTLGNMQICSNVIPGYAACS